MRHARTAAVVALLLVISSLHAQTTSSKTPAQILAENDSSVVLLVSADDESVGLGSGFYVSGGTEVVTNYHVIEGAKRLLLKQSDGRFFDCDTVLAFDPEVDLAVVKVTGAVHSSVRLGNSDAVRVGSPVVVVSNPQGLEHTVSNGLISGIRSEGEHKLFQISAPVSRGSSGGPVFNDKGEVIGVVQSMLLGGQNLNFAIPINEVTKLFAHRSETKLADLPKSPVRNERAAADLDGAWSATFADSLTSGQLTFNLSQDNSSVAGTYTTSLGGGGKITGTVANGTFEFQLEQAVRDCPGTFTGSAKVKEGTLVGTYSGNDCQGQHANGTFSMARATGNAPVLPTTAPAPVAQKPVFTQGTEAELRGVRSAYVYCEDLEVRGNIIKELSKHRDVVSVTEDMGAADVILVFGANGYSLGTFSSSWTDYYGNVYSSTVPRYGITGVGFAVKFSPPNTFRILWQFSDTRTTLYERRPSTNFARNFVKALKKQK